MADPFVDTDVIIRLLTGDDPQKQEEATALFEAVEAGKVSLGAPDTVIADAVFVLASPKLYNLPRSEVHSLLTPLVRLPAFKVKNKRAVARALEIYSATDIDFGDAMIVSSMEQMRSNVLYSYDEDFDDIPNTAPLTRKVPAVRVKAG